MSSDRDITRIVRSWLRADEHESADRVLDAVLERLDTTPQRRFAWWPARRLPEMNNTAKLLLAAAAVLTIAFVGIRFLGGGVNIGGPGPTPTPTATPAALPLPGSLGPGSYHVDEPDWAPVPYSFTVPDGSALDPDGFVTKDADGPGEVMFTTWIVSHVFADVCNDSANTLVDVGTTVDELASAWLRRRTASPLSQR